MIILGRNLPDHKALKVALTAFYGIGLHTSERLLARLQIHDRAKVNSLTQTQLTNLTAFLSSPSTSPPPPRTPCFGPTARPVLRAAKPKLGKDGQPLKERAIRDPLSEIKIESELRREIRENIAHHRMIGSYVGRRHAMGLPVRGQNTRTNAKTAKKLNKIERRG
ncbi:hypothetical protein BOTBODRAFT_545872 [Botryobasidium botryosum FD-172 SS1]|uniref:Small ribosomal subunit protein uS13m n=1 Tax=Botryobasidium botryosum (strain FD-172 SS1) TaxID=930990 RepID=A0A067MQG7_BOTB1|nr:hypothetical protein BOTBODRAFT_545872 [Botryobasidium botryosum FD-172 SS1]